MKYIIITNQGDIEITLDPKKAPATCQNFDDLVAKKFYHGLIFHRVIKNFMIQGGGMTMKGQWTNASKVVGEFAANNFPQNDISHVRGVISMARATDFNSASSQFFIVHQDATFLDREYAAFGHVTKGIEIVDKIASIATGMHDFPITLVVIKEINRID